VISRFSSTVRNIVVHIGFNAFVTQAADVAGIAEAVEKGAEVIMMADDYRFIALTLKSRFQIPDIEFSPRNAQPATRNQSHHIVDNSDATAKGYVAGLDLMAGGIDRQNVLVIGCGPVGRSAVLAALQRGAHVSIFDIDARRSQNLAREINELTGKTVTVEKSINCVDTACRDFNLMIEATNAAGVIHEGGITPETYIAAPGMPLGLTPAAVRKVSDRLLHDPLQLGVTVMAVEAVISPQRSQRTLR
jgi:pyrrolysine biosynthesis protein PylD